MFCFDFCLTSLNENCFHRWTRRWWNEKRRRSEINGHRTLSFETREKIQWNLEWNVRKNLRNQSSSIDENRSENFLQCFFFSNEQNLLKELEETTRICNSFYEKGEFGNFWKKNEQRLWWIFSSHRRSRRVFEKFRFRPRNNFSHDKIVRRRFRVLEEFSSAPSRRNSRFLSTNRRTRSRKNRKSSRKFSARKNFRNFPSDARSFQIFFRTAVRKSSSFWHGNGVTTRETSDGKTKKKVFHGETKIFPDFLQDLNREILDNRRTYAELEARLLTGETLRVHRYEAEFSDYQNKWRDAVWKTQTEQWK